MSFDTCTHCRMIAYPLPHHFFLIRIPKLFSLNKKHKKLSAVLKYMIQYY